MDICSNCNEKTEIVYDIFGDGMVLYCEDCYIDYLAKYKGLTEDKIKDYVKKI